MANQENSESILKNFAAGLDLFDPFQGLVDDDNVLNLRYGYQLGGVNLLIDEFAVSEVIKKPVIYPVPNTPSWIQGLLNLRGILVPVFNLKKHLGLEEEIKSDTLLVIDKGERAFSTFVDTLPVSINVDDEEFSETSTPDNIPDILNPFVKKAFKYKDDIWFEINHEAFIKDITKDYSE